MLTGEKAEVLILYYLKINKKAETLANDLEGVMKSIKDYLQVMKKLGAIAKIIEKRMERNND